MHRFKPLVYIGAILIFLFGVLSVATSRKLLSQFDLQTTIVSQAITPRSFDTFFSVLSLIGSVELLTIVLTALLIIWKMGWLRSGVVMGLYFFGMAIELVGKNLIYHPNPPHMFYRNTLTFFFPSTFVQTGHSYPSGHSYRAVFIVVFALVILLMMKKKTWGWHASTIGLILFLVLMLYSRVTLGEHWASDVIGGGILGAGMAMLSVFFSLQKNTERMPKHTQFFFFQRCDSIVM